MWPVLTTLLLLTAGPSATVTTLSGETITGELSRASSEQLVLNSSAGERSFVATDILTLQFDSAAQPTTISPGAWLELIDGSQIVAREVLASKGVIRATLSSGDTLELPTRSLHSLRLKDHNSDLAKRSRLARQWQDIAGAPAAADVIVIRKLSTNDQDDAMTAVLDQLEGVLGDITEDKVQFTLDDQTIPVDRAKVEGVIYFHPAGRELPDPVCRIDDTSGNRWNVKSLALTGDAVQLVTTSGVKAEIPVGSLKAFDYSAGKIVYLSDLEPEDMEWTNAYGQNMATASLTKIFAPRRDQSFSDEPLSLAGKTFAKGLALHSRTTIDFRLQAKYSKFLATAGIDDKVRPGGDVLLVISLDGKRLGEHKITGKDVAPIALDYDIQGGRKLSITVDFGGGLDVSDRLHLVNARVTK